MTAGTTRRGFLALAGAFTAVAAGTAATPAMAMVHTHRRLHAAPHVPERAVSMVNIHTRETAQVVYWKHGHYQPAAMRHIAHLMRDYHTNQTHHMDPKLLDLLHDLHTRLGTSEPFHLISGYRCPATNAWLARRSGGVAANSLHMRGQAADIQAPGVSLETLHNTALAMARGGVGYYPRSDFVHVDTGRIREWDYG
jgi:uncharacterized protein YcbK (DUF882 family)